MTKILVLYYSSYGHIEQMAYAAAEGVREVEGVEVTVKRVPETVPEDVARQSHFKLDQPAPVATPAELAGCDAVIVGCPTRYGGMASAGGQGERQPSEQEKGMARWQGRHVAGIAKKLKG